jgi:hypothetical protein
MMRLGIPIVAFFAAAAAFAAAPADTVHLADNVVPAPFGYETAAATYVVAEPTRLYISPYIYPGTVNKEMLQPGERVDALAKPKGYDWILAGKNGIGIGYIPISRLALPGKAAP